MIRDLISQCLNRWANLPLLVRCFVFIAVVGGLGLLIFKPGYQLFRQWRLERNLANARKAVDSIRMQEARDLSLTVLRAGDPRIDAFRILEKSTASLRDPRHAEIARAMITHPEGTDDDRLTGFLGVVDVMALGIVGQTWVALPESCQTDPRFAVAFAGRLLSEGRTAEAASVLLGVPEARRDGPVRRGLAEVLISSGRREGFAEAQRIIAAALPDAGPEAIEWLEVLEKIPPASLDAKLLEPIRDHLTGMEGSSPGRSALMLARLDYVIRFQERSEIIEQSVALWREREPLELARFLHAFGLHRRMLDEFDDRTVADFPELLPLMLDAVCHSGDWDRLAKMMETMSGKLPKLDELAWQAVLALKTGDARKGADAWETAMSEAAGSTGEASHLKLRSIAMKAGLPDRADQALLAAIRSGRGPLPLYSELKPLLKSLASQGQEKALMEIGAIYMHFEPGNPVLLTQYAYLACLNELVEPAATLQAIGPLAKALPDEVPIQCALATAYPDFRC